MIACMIACMIGTESPPPIPIVSWCSQLSKLTLSCMFGQDITPDAIEDHYRFAKYRARMQQSAESRRAMKSRPTWEDVVRLYGQRCYVCGRRPCMGIDRLISTLSYLVKNNLRPCCQPDNIGMRTAGPRMYRAQCRRIARYSLGDRRHLFEPFEPQRLLYHHKKNKLGPQLLVAENRAFPGQRCLFHTPHNLANRLRIRLQELMSGVKSSNEQNTRFFGAYWGWGVQEDLLSPSQNDGGDVWEGIVAMAEEDEQWSELLAQSDSDVSDSTEWADSDISDEYSDSVSESASDAEAPEHAESADSDSC